MNPIPWNRHESFPLLSIRHAGSRFARDLENIVDLDFEGGLKILSIRVDSIESTEVCGHVLRTRKVHVWLFHASLPPVGYAGWVENVVDWSRFDRIDTNWMLSWRRKRYLIRDPYFNDMLSFLRNSGF